jgi:hypothetical protein
MLQAGDLAMDEMVCTARMHATASVISEGLLMHEEACTWLLVA